MFFASLTTTVIQQLYNLKNLFCLLCGVRATSFSLSQPSDTPLRKFSVKNLLAALLLVHTHVIARQPYLAEIAIRYSQEESWPGTPYPPASRFLFNSWTRRFHFHAEWTAAEKWALIYVCFYKGPRATSSSSKKKKKKKNSCLWTKGKWPSRSRRGRINFRRSKGRRCATHR